jgi:cytochrome c oxidase subunit 4
MSAVTEHSHADTAHDHADHPTDNYFIKVALVLAVVTALETSTYWWPKSLETVGLVTLLVMMVIKFFMIILIFMHLKFDSKVFSLMFYIGLGLAISVYIVMLMTFKFFG